MSDPPNPLTQKNGVQIDAGDSRMTQVTLGGPSSSTLFFTRSVSTGTGSTTGAAVFAIDRSTNAIKFQG